MSGDRTASNEFGERMEKALAQCHIRPRPRTVSEGVILRAVLAEDATEGARMLEQLVDASPGFGSDRTMKILALLHLASALSDKGEVIAAASRLAEADKELADLASPMGLTDFRNKVAAKVSAKGTVQPKTAILSERELLILQYLRSEMTLREIATDLYLSVNTVKTHARNIYRKLGVASRHQAASLSSMGHPLGSSWSISESTEQASSS
jgi:LuxR family maltose regulon positive regulatory protein